jgi:hypothetical protein
MYAAIMGPIFWLPRLEVDARAFKRVMLVLWAYHSLSAALGVVQVAFPGRFQPNVSAVVAASKDYVESLRITLDSGAKVLRPMGLTDIPGGAAASAFNSIVLSLGLVLSEGKPLSRFAALGAMLLDMACMYLSQVRSLVVRFAILVLFVTLVLAVRRRATKVVTAGVVIGGVSVAGFAVATSYAEKVVTRRLQTLAEKDPTQVYYQNRGTFLEHTVVELLPRYPFGAGVGRWGMMAAYFGDPGETKIWVEIQWTGWLLDGGVPLVLVYFALLLVALRTAWRLSALSGPGLNDAGNWSAVLVAYVVSTIALLFNYAPFAGQDGLDFWFLNGVIFTFARTAYEHAPRLGGRAR